MLNRRLFLTVCFLNLAIAGFSQFATLIVDNNIKAPSGGQIYNDLQIAIESSEPSDVIYVKASPNGYGDVVIDKPLTIIGEGYEGGELFYHKSAFVENLTMEAGADGTRIRGMGISDLVVGEPSFAASLDDIVISHNFIKRVVWNPDDPDAILSGFILENNIIGSSIGTENLIALFIKNQVSGLISISKNIIFGCSNGSIRGAMHLHNAQILNNLFVGDGTQRAFDEATNNTVSLNIFYGRSPEAFLSGSNNGFSNNIAFATTDDDFTKTYASHGINNDGNTATDPELQNIALSNSWNFDDYTMSYEPTSPASSNGQGPDSVSFSQNGEWLPTITSISGVHELVQGTSITLNVNAYVNDAIHDVPQLAQFEFFIGEDPGIGNGTTGANTPPFSGSTFNGKVDIETSFLDPGFHDLYLRISDQQRYGIYEHYALYVYAPEEIAYDIDGLEYFFNDDPGVGSATAIAVSTSRSIDVLRTVNSAVLPTGFHNLFMRTQDQFGRWSLPISSLIYVDNSISGEVTNIQTVEYFFDSDPGFGLGADLTVAAPGNIVDVIDQIPTSGLSTGFHNLFIRAQDDGGIWGLNLSKLVYADPSGATDISNISRIEYFFDDDPGHGNGTDLSVNTPLVNLEITDVIATGSIALGFHNLFYRVQNEAGIWSLPTSQLVYVDASGAANTTNIQVFEYFFDDDPGFGSATPLTVNTPANAVDVLETLTSSGLSVGFHNLFIRALDDGGTWGLSISKIVYVDPSSSGSVTPIQTAEYFFDSDPGYGLASPVDLTDATSIDELILADASSLDLGFHNLFIRIQDTGGRWSLPQSKLLYIDLAGNVIDNISELEYFFDSDPGFGLGLSILIDPTERDPTRALILDASSLPAGNHRLGVRAKNESNVWGITSYEPFISFPPSRELDSVSLIMFYNQTNGADWNQNTGWITGNLDTWYGVDVKNNRVDSINLTSNNLIGALPNAFGYVDELTFISLAENVLQDTIPSSFEDLNKLVTLELYANSFNEIPDLSTILTLENVALDSNKFDFGDLEPLVGIANLTYENQEIFNDFPVDSTVAIGQSVVLNKLIEGVNNTYQWYLNDELIEFGDLEDYTIVNFNSKDTGTYILRINNTAITDLELETQPFHLGISTFEEDSLAMVSLYNALNGPDWTGVSGWLSSPLASWTGLNFNSNNRISSVDLSAKNLQGKLPADLFYVDSLTVLNLSDNSIMDTVPESFKLFTKLTQMDVSNNKISSIPAFNNLVELDNMNVSGNRLQFGDLEKNQGIPSFNYANQDSIGFAADTVIDINSNLTISRMISGGNNTYQWLLNGNPITGNASSNNNEILIDQIQFEDEGKYVLEVKNSQITDLTLHTKAFDLGVSSLERDASALLALYDKTDGDNWTTPVNWITSDITTPWTGISLSSNRVTGIDVSGFGLKDTIPKDVRNITSLISADFADNEIAAIPNMSGMQNLTSVNLDSNRLVFRYMVPNRGISGISFDNQKRFGETVNKVLNAGELATLDDFSNINFGDGSIYQWNFGSLIPGEPFNDNPTPISNTNTQEYAIENVNIESQGTYRLSVTHPDISNVKLQSRNQNILAKTDFFGKVTLNGNPVTEGEVVVWRKTATGPFVKEDSTLIDASGEYILEDVILGTFIVLARPNLSLSQYSNTIQTYYISADTYTEADELLLNGVTSGVDISLIDYSRDPMGTASISGEVISDFPDRVFEEGNSRINGRRKVRKAGCSMRRFKTQGRPDQDNDDVEEEISYYIETDDEGFFNFSSVADGKYLLTIEFPGIPLAEDAEVVFEIGGDRENQVFDVNVLITESEIQVTQNEILYNLKPFIKDLSIYPNPTDKVITMDYLVYRDIDDLQLQIITSEGVILFTHEADNQKGLHHAEIDLANYESGMYYLVFTDESESFAHSVKIGKK